MSPSLTLTSILAAWRRVLFPYLLV